ncbi:MAG: esterase-like activity of phytase family protein [Pseudomonadota bacterium]
MRRGLALLALVGVCALGPVLASGVAPPEIERFDVEMAADARLDFRGALAVRPPEDAYGGLSGALYRDGELLAVGDRAHWARIALRIEAGRLTGVDGVRMAPMLDASGAVATGAGWDAEGLARALGGGLLVSFENDHRIQRFDRPGARAGAEMRLDAWEAFSVNGGLEALAVDPAGRIWAIRERSGAADRPFPVFVFDGASWSEKSLPRDGGFSATGADFGPDGALWIVERDFSFLSGFRTRIRRARWSDGAAPDVIETMAVFGAGDGLDNLEGVAVWREEGETRLLVIADDNFAFLQRNVIAMFALRDD